MSAMNYSAPTTPFRESPSTARRAQGQDLGRGMGQGSRPGHQRHSWHHALSVEDEKEDDDEQQQDEVKQNGHQQFPSLQEPVQTPRRPRRPRPAEWHPSVVDGSGLYEC